MSSWGDALPDELLQCVNQKRTDTFPLSGGTDRKILDVKGHTPIPDQPL